MEEITRKLGHYKSYIRGMIAVWKTGTDGTSGNFDINLSCDKKHACIVPIPIPFVIGLVPTKIHRTTTFQIVVSLDAPVSVPKQNCSKEGGYLRDLAPKDGIESFCVCKYGYAGEQCNEKVLKPSSAVLDTDKLKKWKEKTQVPGMFDLLDAIEKSTTVVTDHVTKVS